MSALLFVLGGCYPTFCTFELEERLDPKAVTLAVGESVTPTVELYTCGGSKTVTDTFVWTSENPQVASVERTVGKITALSEGQTDVEVLAKKTEITQTVTVTVVAPQ